MPRKRDGPAPQETTPGQGQNGDDRPRLLPRLKTPRKPGRTTSPQHRRARRRQDPSWRGFSVRLYLRPGRSDAHALYALLRLAAERYGLTVASVDEKSTSFEWPVGVKLGHSAMSARCPVCPKAEMAASRWGGDRFLGATALGRGARCKREKGRVASAEKQSIFLCWLN